MRLIEFVMGIDFEDIPQDGVERVKTAMVDTLGVALAGSLEPSSKLIARFVKGLGGKPKAGIIGQGFYTSLPDAALANGVAAHALDYDDGSIGVHGHPSCVLIPVILTLSKEYKITGKEAICAYTAAFEAWCRIREAASPAYGDSLGWHPTAPFGHLGAAIAAAKLMKLNVQQAAVALGLAGSMSSGLRANFGTMTKPYHAGHAARCGIVAAMLAKGGFSASDQILEGELSLLHAFSGGKDYHEDVLTRDIGKVLAIVSKDIMIKQYPVCGAAAIPINIMFELTKEHNIHPDMVTDIACEVPFDPPRSLIHSRPKTGLEAKFSLQYCLAAVILDGKVSLKNLTAKHVLRPEAQNLFPKINMHRRPEDKDEPTNYTDPWMITVSLRNGEKYSKKFDPKMSAKPNLKDLVTAKYRDCAGLVLKKEDVDRTLDLIWNMEDKELPELIDIIVGPKVSD